MTCVNCGRGFHKECVRKKGCSKCHPEPDTVESASVVVEAQSLQEKLEETVELPQLQPPPEPKKNKVGGTYADLKDPQSTGRKRAAKLYPLAPDEPCEWQGKKNCGGGRVPIVGCLDGLQVARHHGPVKNTTRNHLGNVHRICTACVVIGTRLLTPDMLWIPAENLSVGDELVDAQLSRTRVTAVRIVSEPTYRTYFDDGTHIETSHSHEWPGYRYKYNSEPVRRTTESLSRGDMLKRMVTPWKEKPLTTFEAGWLSGMYDGEGCLQRNRLVINQALGKTSQRILDALLHLGFVPDIQEIFPDNPKHSPSVSFYLNNRDSVMKLLGLIQPQRLLEKTKIDAYLEKAGTRAQSILRVVSNEFIGDRDVVAITTESGSYIAEGVASYNCHNHWHELNDLVYDEREYGMLPHDPEEATREEIIMNQVEWVTGEMAKKHTLASSVNKGVKFHD